MRKEELMRMDLANRKRAIIRGVILLVLAVTTLWVFLMVTANIGSIFEGVGTGDGSHWWTPILPQMKIAIDLESH